MQAHAYLSLCYLPANSDAINALDEEVPQRPRPSLSSGHQTPPCLSAEPEDGIFSDDEDESAGAGRSTGTGSGPQGSGTAHQGAPGLGGGAWLGGSEGGHASGLSIDLRAAQAAADPVGEYLGVATSYILQLTGWEAVS